MTIPQNNEMIGLKIKTIRADHRAARIITLFFAANSYLRINNVKLSHRRFWRQREIQQWTFHFLSSCVQILISNSITYPSVVEYFDKLLFVVRQVPCVSRNSLLSGACFVKLTSLLKVMFWPWEFCGCFCGIVLVHLPFSVGMIMISCLVDLTSKVPLYLKTFCFT